MAALRAIVRAYCRDHRQAANRELRWFAIQPTLRATIERAARAESPTGKRLAHQRRIPINALGCASAALVACEAELRTASTFDDVLVTVTRATNTIRGIGELYRYDTALRIGAKLGLLPDAVYLHAGVRAGARALGFDRQRQRIEVAELPHPLRALEPHEIEDVLCIYKTDLGRHTRLGRRSTCAAIPYE